MRPRLHRERQRDDARRVTNGWDGLMYHTLLLHFIVITGNHVPFSAGRYELWADGRVSVGALGGRLPYPRPKRRLVEIGIAPFTSHRGEFQQAQRETPCRQHVGGGGLCQEGWREDVEEGGGSGGRSAGR